MAATAATAARRPHGAAVEELSVAAYTVPTDAEAESDATLEWDSTTAIVVEASAGGETGLGYTYGDVSVARFVESKLASVVEGADALAPPKAWAAMQRRIRNDGRQGVGAMAVSAVDIALWDLKARLLGVCLADSLPRFHDRVPVYGSGGFTSYSSERLAEQATGWREAGLSRVKIKVGRDPELDPERVGILREHSLPGAELMVDANGGYQRTEALDWANRFRAMGVTYLEEPLSSEDLEGLGELRRSRPGGIAIAAGEYGWDLPYFQRMLEAGAVDIQQADVTRCGGVTAILRLDGVLKARTMPFSAHCAPAISAHVCAAMETVRHIEYFHDHVRVESLLFDGTLDPHGGDLEPDRDRSGNGLELKRADAERYAA